MKYVLRLIFLAVVVVPAFGCINTPFHKLKDGTWVYQTSEGNVPEGHDFITREDRFESNLHFMDSLYHATNDPDYLSDKGVLLIVRGDFELAIALYLQIEQQYPGRYATASNIGTAYELAGNNEQALTWIKRAIQIDSTSHYGSEWIHVNILQAKIKGPQFASAQFLINTDFGDQSVPVSSLTAQELDRLHKSIFYQLEERMSFIKEKDIIVARLLFEIGNIAFLQKHYADASQDYDLASRYGFDDKLLDARKEVVISRINGTPDPGYVKDRTTAIVAAIGIIIAVIGYSGWRTTRD